MWKKIKEKIKELKKLLIGGLITIASAATLSDPITDKLGEVPPPAYKVVSHERFKNYAHYQGVLATHPDYFKYSWEHPAPTNGYEIYTVQYYEKLEDIPKIDRVIFPVVSVSAIGQ